MTAARRRRVAITGASGRLGSALVTSFEREGWSVLSWTRSEFDLDEPVPVAGRIASEAPELVVHAAAWTDVDGCAREPELAMRRNGDASRTLAIASADAGVSLLLISTNEVFDGERDDRHGYRPEDQTNPPNAYGASKLAAEIGAAEAYADRAERGFEVGRLGIVRTAWLFGPGKPDFPAKIAAAGRLAASEGRPLRVVADEVGTPTYTFDVAEAVVRLADTGIQGIHHLVNGGVASRAEWARDVLERSGVDVPIEKISLAEHVRASRPPRWGVLEASPPPDPALRHWRDAMARAATPVAAG